MNLRLFHINRGCAKHCIPGRGTALNPWHGESSALGSIAGGATAALVWDTFQVVLTMGKMGEGTPEFFQLDGA